MRLRDRFREYLRWLRSRETLPIVLSNVGRWQLSRGDIGRGGRQVRRGKPFKRFCEGGEVMGRGLGCLREGGRDEDEKGFRYVGQHDEAIRFHGTKDRLPDPAEVVRTHSRRPSHACRGRRGRLSSVGIAGSGRRTQSAPDQPMNKKRKALDPRDRYARYRAYSSAAGNCKGCCGACSQQFGQIPTGWRGSHFSR